MDCAFLHTPLTPLKFDHSFSEICWRTQFVSIESAPKVTSSSQSVRESRAQMAPPARATSESLPHLSSNIKETVTKQASAPHVALRISVAHRRIRLGETKESRRELSPPSYLLWWCGAGAWIMCMEHSEDPTKRPGYRGTCTSLSESRSIR